MTEDYRARIRAFMADRDGGRRPAPVVTSSASGWDFDRAYPSEVEIVRSTDGRTVRGYAACFDRPYEVQDGHGHYMETITRTAFDDELRSGRMPLLLWNHGMGLDGKPDAVASVPLGEPLEIRPDGHGLLTVSRYHRGPLADEVLEAIRGGAVTAQSFRGRIVRSVPERVPRTRPGGPLPTMTRMALGLRDFGPTPSPMNRDARILAVRSTAGSPVRYEEMLTRSRALTPWETVKAYMRERFDEIGFYDDRPAERGW